MTIRQRGANVCGSAPVLLLLILSASGCRAGVTRDVAVERYDVTLTVLTDGSLSVVESVTARALAAGATFTRDVPLREIDRIVDVDASIDGSPIAAAGGTAQLDRAGSLHAVWLLDGPTGSRNLTLRYRVVGGLAIQEARAVLHWTALPASRPYSVAASRININVQPPAGFTESLRIDDGRGQFVVGPAQATVDLTSIAPTAPLLIAGEIDIRSLSVAEPQWQTNGARAWRLMPAFVSAGACLVCVGVGIVVMMYLQYSASRVPEDDPAEAVAALRAPLLIAAVVNDAHSTSSDARFAGVLDLARRGRLSLTAEGLVPATPRDSSADEDAAALAHENAIVKALSRSDESGPPIPLRNVVALLDRSKRAIDRGMRADLLSAGLLDPEMVQVRGGLRVSGFASLVLAALAALLTRQFLAKFGFWPMAIPLGLMVVGLVFLWTTARWSIQTPAGRRARAEWRSRVGTCKGATSVGRDTSSELELLTVMLACCGATAWLSEWARQDRSGAVSMPLIWLRQYTSRL